jgi:hypothetical protein
MCTICIKLNQIKLNQIDSVFQWIIQLPVGYLKKMVIPRSGVSCRWAEWAIAHPGFGRIEALDSFRQPLTTLRGNQNAPPDFGRNISWTSLFNLHRAPWDFLTYRRHCSTTSSTGRWRPPLLTWWPQQCIFLKALNFSGLTASELRPVNYCGHWSHSGSEWLKPAEI